MQRETNHWSEVLKCDHLLHSDLNTSDNNTLKEKVVRGHDISVFPSDILLCAKNDIIKSWPINIYFPSCSEGILLFCFGGSLETKLFRGSLMVSETSDLHASFSFPVKQNASWLYKSAPFCVSHSCLSKQISLLCISAWKLSCERVCSSGKGKPECCISHAQWTSSPHICSNHTLALRGRGKVFWRRIYTLKEASPLP